jgi:hypothetical protein
MIKKNFKLMLVVGVMFASVSMMSPVAHADLAPGEGAYLGGFVGYSSGLLQPEITTKSLQINGTFKAKDGGLGLGGIEGGKINNTNTTLKVSGSDTAARLGLTYSF